MPNHGQGGRPSKDIDLYKDEVLDLFHRQHWKQDEIVTWLPDNQDLKINARTLRRRLKELGSQHHDHTEDTEQLRNRIQLLFCRFGATDDEMLAWLKDESFTVTLNGIVRIRLDLNLKGRENSQEAREHTYEIVRGLIEQELGKNVIQSYRLGQLVEHFRQMGHLVIRYPLYNFKVSIYTKLS